MVEILRSATDPMAQQADMMILVVQEQLGPLYSTTTVRDFSKPPLNPSLSMFPWQQGWAAAYEQITCHSCNACGARRQGQEWERQAQKPTGSEGQALSPALGQVPHSCAGQPGTDLQLLVHVVITLVQVFVQQSPFILHMDVRIEPSG